MVSGAMRKLVGNTLLTGLTVVFCLFLTEIGIRVIDGLPVFPVALPPLGGAIGTDTTASHLKNIPLANGVDRAWFATEPPPLPNRTPPPAEWVELDKKLLRTPTFGGGRVPFKSWDMFKAWNSAFVGDVCKHTYLSGAPGRLYVYDPPNASAPDGLVTNAFGWRGPPVQFQRAPKTVRIVFVGASTVAEIHSYPFSVPEYVNDWLNRWAQARKLDLKFEVLNAGRESINSTDIAGVVRQEVAPARPDLVVYYEGNNQLQLSTVVHRALLELQIEGVETSREFHLRMMEDAEFRSGDITIQWLEAKLPALSAILPSADDLRAAVIAAALMAERDRNAVRAATPGVSAPDSSTAWQRAARLEGLRTA